MASKHEGYDTQEQKDDQLEALKVEYENHLRFARPERAKQVAEYAKKGHGVTLGGRSAASE